ncbi:hypothetical protein A9Q73_07285 [Bermanella sp. 47_1433_sub80_T6]|nr:hypothetical protein A9Q73_07285 [Bermanella sp. 47_1433_sub80_T6]
MHTLELKIPPPLVMVVSGLLAFFISGRSGTFLMEQVNSGDFVGNVLWPLIFLALGIAIAVSGVREFARHNTTINPLNPNQSSSVVNSGIFRLSRNPMYLGMLLVLIAWADYLDNLLGFSGAVIFMLYITRFQILPEERILLDNFGEDFQTYLNSVRRWL